jgi:hypothetical protein
MLGTRLSAGRPCSSSKWAPLYSSDEIATPRQIGARNDSPSCRCEKRSDEAISAGGEGGDEPRLSNDKAQMSSQAQKSNDKEE